MISSFFSYFKKVSDILVVVFRPMTGVKRILNTGYQRVREFLELFLPEEVTFIIFITIAVVILYKVAGREG